jgi:hypothetical protein
MTNAISHVIHIGYEKIDNHQIVKTILLFAMRNHVDI